jgi:flagellar M-ring protein FliF
MGEWFRKLFDQIKTLWGKWSVVQRIILISVIVGAIIGIVLLISFNASPSTINILTQPVNDPTLLNRITTRLDQEGIQYTVTPESSLVAPNNQVAQAARNILFREDLIPSGTDPYGLFDLDRWTITDYERDVNLLRARTDQVEMHIEAISEIDNAEVVLTIPEKTLFIEDRDPVTASVIITPSFGSNILNNQNQIMGVERLTQLAVEGLLAENIVISGPDGIQINNWDNLELVTELEIRDMELAMKRRQERQTMNQIKSALSTIFTADRIEVANIEYVMDYGNTETESTEYTPIITVQDNPRTPFDETDFVESITLSEQTFSESFEGSQFLPQGPIGTEGQTPPAVQDVQDLNGNYVRNEKTTNNVVNSSTTIERGSASVQRVTLGVAIDGIWRWEYDDNGSVKLNPDGSIVRNYVPVSDEELEKARLLIRDAVGYNQDRGDSVTVVTLPFDRSEEHLAEDEEFRAQQQLQNLILYILIGIAILLVSFIIFRLVTREIERRRRLREEELARQHQAMREAALRSAEEETSEVEMSVEDRARLEMQENAINIAREHPEDVAQLIRTWIMEE